MWIVPVLAMVFGAVVLTEFAIVLVVGARLGRNGPVSAGLLLVAALIFTMAFGAALGEFAPWLFED